MLLLIKKAVVKRKTTLITTRRKKLKRKLPKSKRKRKMKKNLKEMIGKTLLSLALTKQPKRKSRIPAPSKSRVTIPRKKLKCSRLMLPDRRILRLPRRRRIRTMPLKKAPPTCSPRLAQTPLPPKLKEERVRLLDSLK